MLTPKDIKVLDTLLDKKLDQKLDEKLDQKLKPIMNEQKKQGKKLDAFLRLYDGEHTHLRKRVDRIDNHLNLVPLQYKR
ncbi:MAG: hypothetical protein US96_C0001G0010 [Candidatus Woesebacteria bacterium GW2011_GWB1_38_5b]|uniref:Uncharacterized protein n=1 Tax=Candidatus Woesebacteria bacterium GW2011_GWB1_38_5b TaxID=1618569 RepID=A0A0G0MQI8_9BACT|nr:MAG: hypothetical protein US96_C0001G0010 [Candidatus Woesebacteria bacterium GW2011_GWB1_38_5b]